MLDLLDDEPEMNPVERTPIPEPYWLKVGRWGDDSVTTGLVDPMAEMVYFDGGDDPRAARSISTPDGMKKIVTFCQDDEMLIDADSASFIIHEEYPRLRTMIDGYTPCSAALYYLRFGVIQIAKGKAAMYDRMMQRGQTYYQLGLSGQQTMESIIKRKDLCITEKDPSVGEVPAMCA
ncbi:hypothetical protein YD25_003691 [Salmonella enterica subsp. enterica]|nr:hypothetical protein [Salmonella enterica subsp. enterica]EDY9237568.1 hypothetical protein [Salmonella enterica subsp. enterica]